LHVISLKRLREFWERHEDAEKPLRAWYTVFRGSRFEDPHEVAQVFPAADLVGGSRAVFNIRGNRYRLVVDIRYRVQRAYVVTVMTHSEYGRTRIEEL
jgi:mRNA interferase HigB